MSNTKSSLEWIRGAEIGRGIHGTVYLAMAVSDGSLMAAKTVENSIANPRVKIIRRETNLLKDLASPFVVQYLGFEEKPESLTLFLGYAPGGSLSDLVSQYGTSEDSLTRNFTKQILNGLSYLHGLSIIHGNLNPSNILVCANGSIKLGGFSHARKVSDDPYELDERTVDSLVFYMAPEVLATQMTSLKGDVWSLGTVLFEMTAGKRVWQGLDAQTVKEELSKPGHPPLATEIESSASADFVKACFVIAPDERPGIDELANHPFILDVSHPEPERSES